MEWVSTIYKKHNLRITQFIVIFIDKDFRVTLIALWNTYFLNPVHKIKYYNNNVVLSEPFASNNYEISSVDLSSSNNKQFWYCFLIQSQRMFKCHV